MEALITIIALAFVGFVLVVPLIALVQSRKAKKAGQQSEERWRALIPRINVLERELKSLAAKLQTDETAAGEIKPTGATTQHAVTAPPTCPSSSLPVASPPSPHPVAAISTPQISQPLNRSTEIKGAPQGRQPLATAPPAVGMKPPAQPTSAPARFEGGIEEKLGTNWLNKLGVAILVIGIALLIRYKVQSVGPVGKDVTGFLVAAAMLGTGIFYERYERWRILAWAAIGGGWGLAFFMAYAMRHVVAAQILASNSADIVLLLLFGAGMVTHTLKYRSQTVTGLAFLLAFITVDANRGALPGLYADGVLVVALNVIVVWLQWYELEVFGILAVYITHFYWLQPIVGPLPHPHGEFPGYRLSSELLTFYWLAFLASYVIRKVRSTLAENVSAIAAILNVGMYVWLMAYQSAHPEKSFEFFLMIGTVEFAAGQLPITRRRRAAFIVLTLIGTGLLVAAFPYKFSHQQLSIFWLLEAELLFLAGVVLRENVFRRVGMAVAFITGIQILFADTRQVLAIRHVAQADIALPHLAILYLIAVLVLGVNAHVVPRRWKHVTGHKLDAVSFATASYLALLLAIIGLWVACFEQATVVAWAALGLLLLFFGSRWKAKEISLGGHAVALLAVLRTLFVNLAVAPHWHGLALRPATVSIVAALLYGCSQWAGHAAELSERLSKRIPAAYTWVGSTLVATILWYELRPISVAVAWTLVGLALFEIGILLKNGPLRWQAYFAFLAGFARIVFVNLNAEGSPGQLSPRLYTVLPLAIALFYVYDRLERDSADFLSFDRRLKAPVFLISMAVGTVAALARFELVPDWVIVGWAALTLALFVLAWRLHRRVLLHHGLLMSVAVLFRGVAHNFYERSYFPVAFWSWDSRSLCVGSAIALLMIALVFAFKLHCKEDASDNDRGAIRRLFVWFGNRPEQILFFTSVFLLTVLLALEMRKGMVTVAWGMEGVAVFMLALAIRERSFRLTGLGLLLLSVGKIALFDFWDMTTPDKILTAIVIGSALWGVSYLYTRYREALRQYL